MAFPINRKFLGSKCWRHLPHHKSVRGMTRLIYEVDSPFSDTVLEDEVRKRTPRLFRFRRDSGCDTPLESLSLSLVAQGGTLSVPPRGPKTSFRVLTRVAKPRSCSENYHDMHTLQTSSAGLWPWRARKSVIKLPTFGGQSGSRCALESARAASFGAQKLLLLLSHAEQLSRDL